MAGLSFVRDWCGNCAWPSLRSLHLLVRLSGVAGAMLFAIATARACDTLSPKPIGVILAVGDIMQCDMGDFEKRAPKTAQLIADEIVCLEKMEIPVRVLLLGDLAYPRGSDEDFKCFTDKWERIIRDKLKKPDEEILPVPGNHEYLDPTKTARGFFKHFAGNAVISAAKERSSQAQVKSGGFGYFSTRFPKGDNSWLLLGLNGHLPNSESQAIQYRWLREQLNSASGQMARCVLAFWHDPVFSSGKHGHDKVLPTHHPIRKERLIHSYTILYQSGASLVLNGHDHDYEQFKPHNPDGKLADDGLRSFVIGTGGNYAPKEQWTRWTDIADGPMEQKVDGVLRLDLFPDSYDWRFIPVAGTPISGERLGHGICNERKPLP